jgi:hypothetical protein
MPRRVLLVALVLVSLLGGGSARAAPIEHASFQRVWERTDMPVATQQAARTWMWGPGANGPLLVEPYRESPGGQRQVQYFDKSRMEINNPAGDRDNPWYVTNGLLATELITGRMQVGDNAYELAAPAEVNVAGDPDDPDAPTYATFAALPDRTLAAPRAAISDVLFHDGTTAGNPALAGWGAFDQTWTPETRHWVASPFWQFMTSSGLVYGGGVYSTAPLFENSYYATGYPITDAWWVSVQVSGMTADVLVQCFQRRCLTWTPRNPPEWQVEAGNIGRHYYEWRYEQGGRTPVEAPTGMGDVRLTDIVYDPPLVGADHEWVDITNHDVTAVQLAGWRLTDASGTTYEFPSFKLLPGATVRLHVARGVDTATDLYWGRTGSVWNNGGDVGYLYDATGALVSTFAY